MKFSSTPLPGILLIEHRRWEDDRGYFMETFNTTPFKKAGIDLTFVQDNQSLSQQGVLRGLHAQTGPNAQGKLVRVIRGRVWDVAVDFRQNSPTFGHHFGIELSGDKPFSMWIPPGFLHGFLSLEDQTIFTYKVTGHYDKEGEIGVRFDDPELSIAWPKTSNDYLVSDKDLSLPLWTDRPSPF